MPCRAGWLARLLTQLCHRTEMLAWLLRVIRLLI